MIFTTNQKKRTVFPIELKLHNERIPVVDSYKYLGQTLDCSLTFTQHIKGLVKNVGHKLYLLTKLRRYLTTQAAERVYKVMVLPYFDYGDLFYEACTKDNLNKLQRLKNRALRCISGTAYNNLSLDELHSKFNIKKLSLPRTQHLANFMYKRAQESKYIDNRNLITREHSKKLMIVIKPNIEKVKNSLLFKGSKLWNSLNIEHMLVYEALIHILLHFH